MQCVAMSCVERLISVRTEDVSVTTVDQGRPQRVRKETYTTAALPFPSSHITRYLDRWRKDFRSTLLDWAGTGENPYGTNTIMRQAVKQTWYEVFPELKAKWKSDSNVILGVVSGYVPTSIYSHLTDHFIKSETLLNSWRSEMRKAALRTLGEIFSEKYDNIDSRIAYVAHGLDKKKWIQLRVCESRGSGALDSLLFTSLFSYAFTDR